MRPLAGAALMTAGAVTAAFAAAGAGADSLLSKPLHEALGPWLLGAAALAWLAAWLRGRDAARAWLLVLGLVLFVREVNFEGADPAFALAALGLLTWVLLDRRRLLAAARELPARPLLLAVPLVYVLADVAELRPVRIASGGIRRAALEEALESVGHALFLLAGVLAAARGPRPRAAVTSR